MVSTLGTATGSMEKLRFDLEALERAETSALHSRTGTPVTEMPAGTPPTTPRATSRRNGGSYSPPPAPRMKANPPLLAALEQDSIQGVLAALHDDPDAAKYPFWDHDVEPPLCAAVRLDCNSSIIGLLVEHGADVNPMDVHGHTPWAILDSKVDKRPDAADFALSALAAGSDFAVFAAAVVLAGGELHSATAEVSHRDEGGLVIS